MSDTAPGPNSEEDIVDAIDTDTTRLERAADDILAGGEAGGTAETRPLRSALREDAGLVGGWGRERARRLRGAVEQEPMRASIYALGLGVIIGLLVAR